MSIITREYILKEKLNTVKEGELILTLFELAEELGIAKEIVLENNFSFAAMEFVSKAMEHKTMLGVEHLYVGIKNVYYVVELYLRGYYNQEQYMTYEEFLGIVISGRVSEIIEKSHATFVLHINRLKKLISKAKRRIPVESKPYVNTKELLRELDKDLSICERYPATSANLTDFYFGRMFGLYGTPLVKKLKGFIELEKEVYFLYSEMYILSKLDPKYISKIYYQYVKKVGKYSPFNLFEKVVNNYLFATVYSDKPEKLKISKVDAELLIREIKMETLSADELISQLIDKLQLSGYRAEYLEKYAKYLQNRINVLKSKNYFGELFLIAPPD